MSSSVVQSIVSSFSSLPQSASRRNLLIALLVGGSGSLLLKRFLFQKKPQEQKNELITATKSTRAKYAVDRVFFKRLLKILKIIIPSIQSREFVHLMILTFLLFARTILSIEIADVTGKNAQHLVQRKWKETVLGILHFAAIGIPASCVNSGLKYETSVLSLFFRKRLSETINSEYLNGVNFYKASHLGGENRIDNADQRVTADIEKFCDSLSNLYTTIFKPTLDVILFTRKLTTMTGFTGPLMLFGYYFVSGLLKRFFMPAFGKLTARESELEGDYRTAHQRLITNAEEIAFYDGSKKERLIINRLFNEIFKHALYYHKLKALVGVFDNFLVKYGTSITGYIIIALPVFFPGPTGGYKDAAELTNAYVTNRQLLINLGTAVAQLVVLSNKVTTLAGLTARVAEILEMVRTLDKVGVKPFTVKQEVQEKAPQVDAQALRQWIQEWRVRGDKIREQRAQAVSPVTAHNNAEGGQIIEGKFIKFENVSIVSPDGKLLVENLTFQVKPQQNVMVTGPNGSGKSSLFRILGELWPLHDGIVVKPRKEELLFVPQKPYLVLGTLRDQIIYPHSLDDMKRLGITDEDLTHLLDIVDPSRTITNTWKFDDVRDWFNAFSGGQKQRIAMARVFYHRPLYAILDECTSAVSDEVEDIIYSTCAELGITLFTVSHRKYLRRHHDFELRFEGRAGKWTWKSIDRKNEANNN
mmetsp:Transcript_14929/g.20864  ORF Transcript_14929/g.20864 Transcript_14929/m.20864 type:complete len:700 (-) Transcript_14929:69-2168(-)